MSISRLFLRALLPIAALVPTPALCADGPAPAVALWKVADEDTTIYLMGTVHVLPPGVIWSDDRIETALASADELVTELTAEELDETKMAELVLQIGLLPPGMALRDMMSEAQRADYDLALRKNGLQPNLFDRMEPWLATMGIGMLPLTKAGYASDSGVEDILASKIGPTTKRLGLETAAFQMSVFDGLPQDEQLKLLHETVVDLDTSVEDTEALVAAWRTGDADKLAAMINEDLASPIVMERLLTARNRSWAGWIHQRLKNPGTVFMAVGAGHLAGSNSVQAFLERGGITVTRVP